MREHNLAEPPSISLNAAHWRRLRERAIERTGGRCEHCGRKPRVPFLHHRTYERFGAELPEDVELLCQSCHKLLHFAQPELVRPPFRSSRPPGSRRRRVRAIVKVIRMGTVCERCGDPAKAIEWHHDEHPQHPELRVANLVDDGKPLEIVVAEIDRCEAVCRKCHVNGDVRGVLFRTQTHSRGEGNGRAKLTAVQVEEIRAAYAADSGFGRQAALARQYGVSLPTVNHIVCGRTWRAAA